MLSSLAPKITYGFIILMNLFDLMCAIYPTNATAIPLIIVNAVVKLQHLGQRVFRKDDNASESSFHNDALCAFISCMREMFRQWIPSGSN